MAAVVVMSFGIIASDASVAAPIGSSSKFSALPPKRILDTRVGLGAAKAVVAPGASVNLTVAGKGGVPVSGATTVVLNVTVTQATRAGYVQVFPTGQATVGSSSNLNVEFAGQTIANLVTAPVGADGTVTIYTQGGGHLIADVFGYYTPSSAVAAGRYTALNPSRVRDTRQDAPTYPGDSMNCGDFTTWTAANGWFWRYYPYYGDVAGLDGDGDLIPCETLTGAPSAFVKVTYPAPKPAAGSTTSVQITDSGAVPAGAAAVVLNVTATQSAGAGYVQVMPGGAPDAGKYSNLNLVRTGQTAAGLATVPLGDNGTVSVYTSTSAHLILDVAGYYTGPTAEVAGTGLFVAITPTRMTDSRSGPIPGSGAVVPVAPGGRGGVPSTGVEAVAMNLTATQTTGAGYLTAYPSGTTRPLTSNLNMERAKQTIANAALTKVGGDGTLKVYVSASAHVLADVAGYFTGESGATVPQLSGLTVAPQNTSVDYDRDSWNLWIDADGDCQNTRQEVLIRSSSPAPQLDVDGCSVLAGTWVDPYTGQSWTSPSEVQIDHLVALANAHRSGGWAWDAAQKEAFANDLASAELRAVAGAVNTAKSDSGPEAWKPPATSAWCDYATEWAAVKRQYVLTVTQAEYDALAQMVATC